MANQEAKYPWHLAPEWAQWAATDYDGRSYFYPNKPVKSGFGEWDRGEKNDQVRIIGTSWEFYDQDQWENSIEKRPDNK